MSATKTVKEKISQETPKKVEVPSAGPQQVQVLSREDTQVSDLVKEQPKTVAEIQTKELKLQNILELPEECDRLHKKKYRYKWLAKTRNLESRLRSGIWTLCTRDNSPYIKEHRFKSHGAVEQAGMLLAFATEEAGKRREEAPAKKSAQLVKHYTEDLPTREAEGFYKPKDAGDSGANEEGFEMDY